MALVSLCTALAPKAVRFELLDPWAAAVLGGFLVGFGLLALLRHRARVGGVNILAQWLQQSRSRSGRRPCPPARCQAQRHLASPMPAVRMLAEAEPGRNMIRHIDVSTLVAALAFTLASWAPAAAQEVRRTPLPTGHPLLGSWRIDVPGTACHEVYTFKADGTTQVTSGEQAAESEFEIPSEPASSGFYKWVDKVTKDNGKPDCMGSTVDVGHVATNYIILHRTRREFLMCQAESLRACIGPFKRIGSDV